MKYLNQLLAAAMLLAACLTATSSQAQTLCEDKYHVVYTVQLTGQTLWLSPDEPLQLAVPGSHDAVSGQTTLSFTLNRSSDTHLKAQFMFVTSATSASTNKQPIQGETLIVSIAMDKRKPIFFAGQLPNPETGSLWGIALTPACRPSQIG